MYFLVALGAMHILSVLMGYALPNLIPKAYTHVASMVSLPLPFIYSNYNNNFGILKLDFISLFWIAFSIKIWPTLLLTHLSP